MPPKSTVDFSLFPLSLEVVVVFQTPSIHQVAVCIISIFCSSLDHSSEEVLRVTVSLCFTFIVTSFVILLFGVLLLIVVTRRVSRCGAEVVMNTPHIE